MIGMPPSALQAFSAAIAAPQRLLVASKPPVNGGREPRFSSPACGGGVAEGNGGGKTLHAPLGGFADTPPASGGRKTL